MTKFYRKEHLSSLNMSRVNCFLCGGGLTDQEHLTQHHLIGRQDASDLVSNLSKLLEDEICEVAEFVDKLLSSHSDSWRLEEEDASLCKLEAEADDAEDKYIKGEVAEDEEDNEDKEEISAKRAKLDPDYEEDPGYKFIKQSLRILFRSLNHEYDSKFDWNILKKKSSTSHALEGNKAKGK